MYNILSVQTHNIGNIIAITRSNFIFQNGFLQKDEEEKFDNSEKFAEKSLAFFVLFICHC